MCSSTALNFKWASAVVHFFVANVSSSTPNLNNDRYVSYIVDCYCKKIGGLAFIAFLMFLSLLLLSRRQLSISCFISHLAHFLRLVFLLPSSDAFVLSPSGSCFGTRALKHLLHARHWATGATSLAYLCDMEATRSMTTTLRIWNQPLLRHRSRPLLFLPPSFRDSCLHLRHLSRFYYLFAGGARDAHWTGTNEDASVSSVISMGTLIDVPAIFHIIPSIGRG